MSKTGMRGSSEAIGSWKTTWRSRRIALRSLPGMPPTSLAEHDDAAAVGGLQVQHLHERGGLAAARLADQPERLALADLEVDAVDGVHRADPPPDHRALHQRDSVASSPSSSSTVCALLARARVRAAEAGIAGDRERSSA